MKKQDKPKMAMKVTKVVAKPAGKMPVKKVEVKSNKVVVKPKPAKVTIGRLKQVVDSLKNQAQLSDGGGDSAYGNYSKNKKSGKKDWLGRSPNEALAAADRMYSSARSDYDRADRYEKIIAKSAPKKK